MCWVVCGEVGVLGGGVEAVRMGVGSEAERARVWCGGGTSDYRADREAFASRAAGRAGAYYAECGVMNLIEVLAGFEDSRVEPFLERLVERGEFEFDAKMYLRMRQAGLRGILFYDW